VADTDIVGGGSVVSMECYCAWVVRGSKLRINAEIAVVELQVVMVSLCDI